MEMLVNIPQAITDIKNVSQGDIVMALAVQLYVGEEMSLGKAAEIAGMTRLGFQKLLADKNIPSRYNMEDLARELQTVKSFLGDDSN